MESEVTVSSAPEQGEATPFERLCRCMAETTVMVNGTQIKILEIVARDVTAEEFYSEQHLATDSGDPLDFMTALQLASSFLLARLEESK